jgi:hypothetical protein
MLMGMAGSKGDMKVKLVLCIIRNCGMEECSYSSTIFDLGTRWSGQLHGLAALLPRNRPWYSLGRRLCGPKSHPRCHEEEKSVTPAMNRILAVQLVFHHYTD